MRVHFINRFYWPAETATAQLLTDLAEGLASRGWTVTVFSGHSQAGLADHETRHGVAIRRIGRRMAATQSLSRRAVDFAWFHLGALPALFSHVRRGDAVVALTDPPLIGITAMLAGTFRGARTVHWVQDIYPEILPAVNPHPANRLVAALLRWPRDIAWRRSAACVTLGRQMIAQLQRSGVPLAHAHAIPNWAPRGIGFAATEEVEALRHEWQLGGKFVIGYSGNLGRVHDLSHILDVAHQLRDEPKFVFLFIGTGAAFADLRRGVEARQLRNVHFRPAAPREALRATLGVPDVHLISLRAGCEHLVFPSKLYGVAAAGRPILLLAAPDAEIAEIVRREGLGLVFSPDDVAGMTRALRELAAENDRRRSYAAAAVRFHGAQGGSEEAAARWNEVLRHAIGAEVTATATEALTPKGTP